MGIPSSTNQLRYLIYLLTLLS